MIQVKKNRKSKSILAIIITSAVLALLVAGFVVVSILLKTKTEPQTPIGPGSTHSLYTPIGTNRIQSFGIDAHEGYIGAELKDGTYYLFYENENGEKVRYLPAICFSEPGFKYESLYAVTDDGMNVYKFSYVLYAISNASYDSKISLTASENATSREEKLAAYEEQLKAYGLDKDSRETVTFTYTVPTTDPETGKTKDETKEMTLYIGNKLVTGIGYYLKLSGDVFEGEERDSADSTVYISSGAENFKYALTGFNDFVAPRVIMAGNLSNGDENITPQYTPSYKQWKNTVYDRAGDVVKEKTKVIVTANTISSPYAMSEVEGGGKMTVGENGYSSVFDRETEIDLEYIAEREEFSSLINALVGKEVRDDYNYSLTSTVIFNGNVAVTDKTYSYKIYEIESFVDADGNSHPTADGGNNFYVKVRYSCTLDGKEVKYSGADADKLHAIIDLTDERVDESVRLSLLGGQVGVLSSPLEFNVSYSSANSEATVTEIRIKHVSQIYDKATFKEVQKISGNSVVVYVYQMLYDGKVINERTAAMDLSLSDENLEDYEKGIKTALLGLKMDQNGVYEKDKTAYTFDEYNQVMQNFTTYEIKSIDYFVESEAVAAFAYTTSPDPYYGGDIHENILNEIDENHPYASYAVDWRRTDRVVKVLSGTVLGTSSLGFEGLSGSKVVATGLTPKNMENFGLYAYTVEFAIPRFANEHNDFEGESVVTFTLYISEKNAEGKRYVGSDMYDTIVEIDGGTFDYVEESFVDFWAKRDIMLVDQEYVNKMSVDFNMEGLRGKYDFNVAHPTVWIVTYADGSRARLNYDPGDDPNIASKQKYIAATVYASVSGSNLTETLLVERLRATGQTSMHIHAIYNYRDSDPNNQTVGFDYLGDSSFKDVLLLIYGTNYTGTLSEEEANAAMAKEPVMTLDYEVEGSNTYKIYRFYYTDVGSVAVSVDDGAKESCYFTISNYAFKTVVRALSKIVNGYPVSEDGGYAN